MTAAARATHDRPVSLGVAFGFAVSLGIATVAIPLVAIGAGYAPAEIGLLVAISAASQLATRFALPWLLGRFPDRALVAAAAVLTIGAFALLLASTALPAFTAAQLGLGASRAIFWTSSQTHAIRGGGLPMRRLVDLNLAANIGTLVGPVVGGALAAIWLPGALLAALVAASGAAVATPWLAAFPPYDRRGSRGTFRLLRHPGVDVACWANLVGGVWWSMIGSFVPVVLVAAGLGPALIGALVTLSEGAGAATLLVLRRFASLPIAAIVRLGAFVEVAALAGIAVAPPHVLAYAVLLVAGGSAAGCVTSLSSALVALAAREQEQGDALALSGMFRSFALLGAPATVSALLAVVALPVALVGVAASAALPGLVLGRSMAARRPAPEAPL
jgi:hypothetical protein